MKTKAHLFVFVVETAILASIVYLEQHPNVYAERLLVIGRLWAFYFMLVVWACVLGFALGVPSPRVANNAVGLTTPSILRQLALMQQTIIVVVSLAFGRWWFCLCYALFIIGLLTARGQAREYLKRVKRIAGSKHAVIEVDPTN